MRGLIVASLLPLLASAAPAFSTETIHEGVAPLLTSSNSEEVPDSYIVVFKKHVTEASASDHHSWVQDIHLESETQRTELRKRSQFPITDNIFEGLKHTYNIAGNFLGYSGHFDDEVIEKVRRHPDVSSSSDYFLPFSSFCGPNRMSEHAVLLSSLSHLQTRYLCTLGCLGWSST
jgi:cerevisin